MPKSDNKHAVNMYNSLEKHIGRAEAEAFNITLPLSKSADYIKKSKWASGVCAWLDDKYSEDEIRKIRMDCSCDPGGRAEKFKKIYESSTDMASFCEQFTNESPPGSGLSYDGAALYLTYPTCYCSCVKRGDKNLTKAWCYCSLGYAEKMFSSILSRKVKTELMESVKTGGEKCVIKII